MVLDTNALFQLNTGLGGIKNFNIILQGTDNELLNDLALTWPNIPNGAGVVSLGNESTVYSGTYVKFSDVLGSITFENAAGVLYNFNVDFPKGTAHLYSSNWKYLGHNTGNCSISLPEHREIYIAVDFQSQSNNARTLLIPNIRSFEVDLYGQIGGITDYVRIYYHQSAVGMYKTSSPAGIENFKLAVWYR